MDLSIQFVCPDCGNSHPEPLNDLAPGRRRRCPDCGGDLRLTEESQAELHRSIVELFSS